jgi:hypothetical protein
MEPVIGHLKSDSRLSRNYLKGTIGDHINLLMAAYAWNLKQWLLAIFWPLFDREKSQISSLIGQIKLSQLSYPEKILHSVSGRFVLSF